MIRLLIFILMIYLGYKIVKTFGRSLLQFGERQGIDNALSKDTELIQDPQCGTYFMKQRGVRTQVDGETLHFCSRACMEEYLKGRRSG